MDYPLPMWDTEPENKIMMSEVQKYPEKSCSVKSQMANFSDEESYETAGEGEDDGSCTCPLPSVLSSSINHMHDTETKQSIESYQGIIVNSISCMHVQAS
jgi:hypothetical protein